MSRHQIHLALVVCLAIVGVAIAPAPVAAQELSIDGVEIPNSVTADEPFDIEVDVSGDEIDNEVDVTLGLPSGVSCSPTGSQTVTLSDGSATATFSCDADAPGDYSGEIAVAASGETNDGNSISDSIQTGLTVTSPASISLTSSLDADSVNEGDSTTLTVSVSNTGDISTSYDLSVTPDSGLSADIESGSESGSIDGGDTVFVTYTVSGDSTGDQDITITLMGGNGQEITAAETVTVEGDTGGGGGGGGSSTPSDDEPTVIDDPETLDPPSDVEPARAERAPIEVDPGSGEATVTFTEQSTTERITFEGGDLEGEVTVADYDTESEETGSSPGRSISVTQITVPDPDRSGTIRKRVSQDRLDAIEGDAEDLRVNRFDESTNEWHGLESEIAETGDEHVVVEAETPGFSFFSVSATSEPDAVIDAPSAVEVGEEFTLDGGESDDRYGEIVAYEWSVGDERYTGETVTITAESSGGLDVELVVENDAGETAVETMRLSVRGDATEPGTEPEPEPEPEPESEPAVEPDDQSGFGVALTVVAVLSVMAVLRWRS